MGPPRAAAPRFRAQFIPGSRYERTDVQFSYYVPSGGGYCLSFQNRNAEPISVNVTVVFP
jgi:hypothetical protein